MKKEALKLANIKSDLDRMANFYMYRYQDRHFEIVLSLTLVALILGIYTKRLWIGLAVFALAIYPLVQLIRAVLAYYRTKAQIKAAIERADISISVETLDHIVEETIYEPHAAEIGGRMYRHSLKTVKRFYFAGGGSWCLPGFSYRGAWDTHYAWSKDYYMSSAGLCNSSTEGEKFFFVCLQGYYDIAYIYPCDRFELGELKTGHEDGI